jgi:hypothetical protein
VTRFATRFATRAKAVLSQALIALFAVPSLLVPSLFVISSYFLLVIPEGNPRFARIGKSMSGKSMSGEEPLYRKIRLRLPKMPSAAQAFFL